MSVSGVKYEPVFDWMRGHYHCPKCGGEMECWKSFGCDYNPSRGVSRLGGCEKCGKYMIEFEKGENVWLYPTDVTGKYHREL